MSANVIAFPKCREVDVSARASDEHLLVALTHRDALLTIPNLDKAVIDCRCVVAGIDGLAQYLRGEFPRLSNAQVADYLRTVLAYYCRDKLGVGE